jgi:hypothetical protein
MRTSWLVVAAVVAAGCGGHGARPSPTVVAPRPTGRSGAVAAQAATPAPAEHAHGAWSRPRVAAAAPRAAVAALHPSKDWTTWRASAASAGGRSVVAAIEIGGDGRARLRVAAAGRTLTLVRLRGGSDYPPLADVAVALDERGRALVVYAEPHRVRALTLTAAGRPGPARTLGPAYGVATVVAAVAPGGRAVVAWGTYDAGEEIDQPCRIFAASRDAGGARFASARQLDRGGVRGRSTGHPHLAVTSRGALLTWNVVEPHHHRPVRVARAAARGGFGPARTLGEGTAGDVAMRADGTALVAWTQDFRAYAALVRPGGAFGRAEAVSDRDRAQDLHAAFDRAGRARLEWATRRPPNASFVATRGRS